MSQWYLSSSEPVDGVLVLTIRPNTSYPESLWMQEHEWVRQASFYLDTPTAPYSMIVLVYARIPNVAPSE